MKGLRSDSVDPYHDYLTVCATVIVYLNVTKSNLAEVFVTKLVVNPLQRSL